jgi:hypothetical protein
MTPNLKNPVQKTVLVKLKLPLIIIGHLETNSNSLIIDPNNLKIVKTYTDPQELKAFGEKGKNGVILAELIHKTPLLKLEEVLAYFKVPAENRTLKVLVDNTLVNPSLFLADVEAIKEIEVTEQDLTAPVRYSWNKDEKFLNIVTAKN